MSTPSKKLILKSNDGETFEVDVAVASESGTIKLMIEEAADKDSFTLQNVRGNILAKVIEYCKKHVETPSDADADLRAELNKFDAEFVNLDFIILGDLLLAADYLEIPGLLDVVSGAIAENIKDKETKEIRRIFNIENDFTTEEEKEFKKKKKWFEIGVGIIVLFLNFLQWSVSN